MKFRTEIEIEKFAKPLFDYDTSFISFGSCFASEIGTRLQNCLFNVLVNPMGTLYNPASIRNSIEIVVNKSDISTADLFCDQEGIWHSYCFHSSFSSNDSNEVTRRINNAIEGCRLQISRRPLIVMLTLGSARAFKLRGTSKIVGNCHKQPASLFETIDLNIDSIVDDLEFVYNRLHSVNSSVRFIITVSPIRHKAYGLHTDKLSKARLLLAVDEFVSDKDDVFYFPAYEIMIDDLRDYRFYDIDMIHPGYVGVDYIFQLFCKCYLKSSEHSFLERCVTLGKRLNHRIMNQSNDNALFIEKTKELKSALIAEHPHVAEAINRIENNGKEIYN